MLTTLRTKIRAYLGTGTIPRLEILMASAKVQLDELKTQFSDFSSDVDAKLNQLVAAQGELSPEAQVVFDELKASVAAADSKVGDADGSDTVVPPVEPTDPEVPQV
jgi:hypothetical protein